MAALAINLSSPPPPSAPRARHRSALPPSSTSSTSAAFSITLPTTPTPASATTSSWLGAPTTTRTSPPSSPIRATRPRSVRPPITATASGAERFKPVPVAKDDAAGAASAAETGPPPPSDAVSFRLFGRSYAINPRLALLMVPFLWGSLPPLYKLRNLLPWAISPAFFNASRLLVSFLCVSGNAKKELKERPPDTKKLLRAGAQLGALTFGASTLQMLGVQYTSASRAAFITQLQTVLVPFIAAAAGDRSGLSGETLIASVMALAGVACLTLDSAAAPLTLAGDGTCLLAAVVAAVMIVRTREVAVQLRSSPLVSYKVMFQFLCAAMFMAVSGLLGFFTTSSAPSQAAQSTVSLFGGIAGMFAGCTPLMLAISIGFVFWAGVIVSAGSTWLHVKANTVVPATESAIMFSFTPLWASLFAMFLGERFGIKGVAGAALIVLSTFMSSAKAPKAAKKVGGSDTAS